MFEKPVGDITRYVPHFRTSSLSLTFSFLESSSFRFFLSPFSLVNFLAGALSSPSSLSTSREGCEDDNESWSSFVFVVGTSPSAQSLVGRKKVYVNLSVPT